MTAEQPERGVVGDPAAPPVIVRRGRSAERFVPKSEMPQDSGEVIVGRGLLGTRNHDRKSQTSRERQVAGDLPEWEPMPPGELLVRRPGST